MIYFHAFDYPEPSGGIWAIYRQVDVLNAAGIPATVLHSAPGFRLDWFAHDTPVAYIPEITAEQEDIVVIAALIENGFPQHFPGLRKVIFNQGAYMTLHGYDFGYTGACHYRDALATIVTSEDTRAYLAYAYPGLPIHRVICGIDPKHFYYDPAQKKAQIAFVVGKNLEHAKQVVWMLRRRGVTCPFVPIQDAPREEVARILRESRIFMNFGCPEGFGLPPAEAMACGCQVVGYDGRGGREFLKAPYAMPIAFSDIVGFVQAIEGLIDGRIHLDPQEAAEFIRTHYGPEQERESILRAWHQILAG